MSMPSDTTPDVTEAMERVSLPPESRRKSQLTAEQAGWAVAALVAFLGITYVGPALARLGHKPTAKERMAQRLRAARRRAQTAGAKAHKKVRRLGGGTIWR